MAEEEEGRRPALDVLSGALHEDGWATQKLALRILQGPKSRTLRVTVRNPGFNAAYLRNPVTIRVDDQVVFSELMFAGQTVTIEQVLPAREDLLLEVDSEAVMVPDYFDARERGVMVRLSA